MPETQQDSRGDSLHWRTVCPLGRKCGRDTCRRTDAHVQVAVVRRAARPAKENHGR